jgi:hypothetical protein
MSRRQKPHRRVIVLDDPRARAIQHREGLLAHARLSHRYWLGEARLTRLGLSDSRYGGAYAIDGAGTWRRRAGELLAQLRQLRPQRRPRR